MMNEIQTDALRTAQRKYMEQYAERIGYEYRAAYRRGYDYLQVITNPDISGTEMAYIHTNAYPLHETVGHTFYHVDEQTADEIAEARE